ncbi:MAG: hypothetical protein DWQ37_17175 [Planctomycetota bacterium]|nr:MAG: hypothetical protein DWQ37_17175 [Planctomycetota bacterium]
MLTSRHASQVVVALCLLVSARSSAWADDAPAAAPSERGKATVNVVAYGDRPDGGAAGICRPVYITAEASADGTPRVGFFESQVGATGNQWRSAGWMAALTAATLSDFDPRATRVSIEYQGGVDGPSAGALLTIGILAAVRGDTVRSDAAMTGAINPDGSIGPVGGIPHKIEGAADKGMKLLLIPGDKRMELNKNTKEIVDLVEYGQSKGVEVRRVFNIYEAYELMTGVELPRPPAAAAPRVSLAVQQRIKKTIVDWMDRYKHALEAYQQLSGEAKYSEEVEAMYLKGVEAIKQCRDLLQEGEVTASMWDAVMANAYSYLAMETARCRYTYANLGYAGVVNRLRDNNWLDKDVAEISRRLKRETPRTLDQLSVYLGSCDAYLEGVSLQIMAKAILANMPEEDSEEALELAAQAAGYQIVAWLDMKLVGDYLDWQDAYDGIPIPQLTAWRQTGQYMFHAASANLAVFDSLVIEPRAEALSVAPDLYRNAMASKDMTYGIVLVAQKAVLPNLEKFLGDGEALDYAYLAMNIYTHTRAAALLAKHYGLGAELDEDGEVTRIPRERTLGELLTYADDQSRRNIALLQEAGLNATVPAQMHAIATIKSRRDVPQKLEALQEYWAADAHARILRILSGVAQKQQEEAAPVNKGLSPDPEAATRANSAPEGGE